MINVPAGSDSEPDQILARQRAAFLRDGPPPLKQRRSERKPLERRRFSARAIRATADPMLSLMLR